jgi:hypothetical protein
MALSIEVRRSEIKMMNPKIAQKMPNTNWKGLQQVMQRLTKVLACWFRSWWLR